MSVALTRPITGKPTRTCGAFPAVRA